MQQSDFLTAFDILSEAYDRDNNVYFTKAEFAELQLLMVYATSALDARTEKDFARNYVSKRDTKENFRLLFDMLHNESFFVAADELNKKVSVTQSGSATHEHLSADEIARLTALITKGKEVSFSKDPKETKEQNFVKAPFTLFGAVLDIIKNTDLLA